MTLTRRTITKTAALASIAPAVSWLATAAEGAPAMPEDRLVLSDFEAGPDQAPPGVHWRGFSDRVMGGVSDASISESRLAGKNCIRLTGRVTTDNGGGFIQMAMDLGNSDSPYDGSAYAGIDLLVYGNDEDYNVHVRTADCGWYDQSYRATFRAEPRWQRLRLPWSGFTANGVTVPLNPARLQRIAVLGWMREFEADIALAEAALYS